MTTWDPHERWLTIPEAALSVARPESTIRRWLAEGRLNPVARWGKRILVLEADVLKVDADTRNRKQGA